MKFLNEMYCPKTFQMKFMCICLKEGEIKWV